MARTHHNTTRSFSHLTVFDRGQIQALRNQGKSLQAIADIIGCHKSTISRVLKRGTVTQRRSDLTEYQAYFANVGQRVYESNRSRCGAKYKLIQTTDFIHFAVQKIRDDHGSPDAVCGYAKTKRLFDGAWVCTKTLYRYIDLGLFPIKNIDLPVKVSRNTKKKRTRQHQKMLGTSIEQRPRHIDERLEFGHWEIDTVIGTNQKGAALLTLTERKTRKEHILKIERKRSMDDIDPSLIIYVENWCNTLPRKILAYRSPKDAFHEELRNLALSLPYSGLLCVVAFNIAI